MTDTHPRFITIAPSILTRPTHNGSSSLFAARLMLEAADAPGLTDDERVVLADAAHTHTYPPEHSALMCAVAQHAAESRFTVFGNNDEVGRAWMRMGEEIDERVVDESDDYGVAFDGALSDAFTRLGVDRVETPVRPGA